MPSHLGISPPCSFHNDAFLTGVCTTCLTRHRQLMHACKTAAVFLPGVNEFRRLPLHILNAGCSYKALYFTSGDAEFMEAHIKRFHPLTVVLMFFTWFFRQRFICLWTGNMFEVVLILAFNLLSLTECFASRTP